MKINDLKRLCYSLEQISNLETFWEMLATDFISRTNIPPATSFNVEFFQDLEDKPFSFHQLSRLVPSITRHLFAVRYGRLIAVIKVCIPVRVCLGSLARWWIQ